MIIRISVKLYLLPLDGIGNGKNGTFNCGDIKQVLGDDDLIRKRGIFDMSGSINGQPKIIEPIV